MSEIEIEAKTVEEAIEEGLKKLNVSRDRVEIKILSEGTSGLFGLMGTKPARVLLATKEPSTGSAPQSGEEAGEDHGNVDFAAAQTKAKEIVGTILRLMQVQFTDITTSLMTGRVSVEVRTPESNILIGKNGQTLEALEGVVNLMLNRDEHTRAKVSLDVEGYRHRQEERLQTLAGKAAEQVVRTGRPYRFDPMPAKERRVLHVALKSHADVETFSEGEGIFRKVVIKPKQK